MGHHDDGTSLRGAGGMIAQCRADAVEHVEKAFPPLWAAGGKRVARHRPQIGQFGIAQAILLPEILFPQPRVDLGGMIGEKGGGAVTTSLCRACDDMANRPEPWGHGRQKRLCPRVQRHIETTTQPPPRGGGRMADQNEFGAGEFHHRAFQVRANLLFHVAMAMSILITGGARSGKSELAERKTLGLGGQAIYIATAEAFDDEMRARIDRHRARRGPEWQTLNAPVALVSALRDSDADGLPRLVDCITLWLSNLMLADRDWQAEVAALADLIPRLRAPVVFVTNEVGSGIVPDNALARAYRDAAGLTNQRLAAACDELWFCVSGHPLKVK